MKAGKLFIVLCFATLLALPGCNQDITQTPIDTSKGLQNFVQTAGKVEHRVTGSGEVAYFGISFRNSVAAHSDAAGNAWGEVTVPLNLAAFGLGRMNFSGHVTCLSVDGNSAWIGFTVQKSTNGDFIPKGANAIVLVRDLGGPGQDITDGELFTPDTRCTDHPTEFLETVVLNGNYAVR